MSKFYDFVNSKKKQLGKNLWSSVKIEEVQENKIIIEYKSVLASKESDSYLKFLVVFKDNIVSHYLTVSDFIPLKVMKEWVKEGTFINKLINTKEYKNYLKEAANEGN